MDKPRNMMGKYDRTTNPLQIPGFPVCIFEGQPSVGADAVENKVSNGTKMVFSVKYVFNKILCLNEVGVCTPSTSRLPI